MIQDINLGAAPNSGDGDGLRTGGEKINANFQELDSRVTAAQAKANGVDSLVQRTTSLEQAIINQQQQNIDVDSALAQLDTRTTALENADDGVPPGGTTGQVLAKVSDVSGDTGWIDPPEGGGGEGGGPTLPSFPLTATTTLIKSLFGKWKNFSGGGNPITTNLVMELETPFMGLKLGIPNIHENAQPGVRVCVGLMSGRQGAAWLVDIVPTSGWFDLTFDGQSSVTLPARVNANEPSWTWTDLFDYGSMPRTDGVRRPLIIIRIEYPAGSVGSAPFLGISNWRAASSPRYLSCGSQNVLGVTDKESFTQTLNTEANVCVPAVKYYTERAGKQLLVSGDSTVEGIQGSPQAMGAAQTVAYANSTPDNPIEYFNAAIHSVFPLVYSSYLLSVLPWVKPTHLIYSPYSVNEAAPGVGLNGGALRNLKNALGKVLEAVRDEGRPIKTILLEGLPVNSAGKDLGEGDQTRRDFNEWINQFKGPFIATGYASVVTGARINGQDQLLDTMSSGDNLHPNSSGYNALANVLAPYIL